jgi:hypothetical protein
MMTPRPYPLLANLRYAYYEEERSLPILENAWWEARLDGGCVLGAVTEAMGDLRSPYRLRVRLRLKPDGSPREMELTLLRPDGEGRASYQFEPERVRATGEWQGHSFDQSADLPAGYSIAPHCFAADGLHFFIAEKDREARRSCYGIDPRRAENPLLGAASSFTFRYQGEENCRAGNAVFPARRFTAAYENAPDRPADFWVYQGRYPLRMDACGRKGTRRRILCDRLKFMSKNLRNEELY